MRKLLLTLPVLLLAACAGGETATREPVVNPVTSSFAVGEPNVVEVQITDPQPADQVELVGPNGQTYAAYQIQRDRIVEDNGGGGFFPNLGIGLGVFGGSRTRVGTSVGVGLPLGGVDPAPHEPQVKSLARIRVEDMSAYRADWADWKLRIRFGPEANPRIMELPAPRPPEAAG